LTGSGEGERTLAVTRNLPGEPLYICCTRRGSILRFLKVRLREQRISCEALVPILRKETKKSRLMFSHKERKETQRTEVTFTEGNEGN